MIEFHEVSKTYGERKSDKGAVFDFHGNPIQGIIA